MKTRLVALLVLLGIGSVGGCDMWHDIDDGFCDPPCAPDAPDAGSADAGPDAGR